MKFGIWTANSFLTIPERSLRSYNLNLLNHHQQTQIKFLNIVSAIVSASMCRIHESQRKHFKNLDTTLSFGAFCCPIVEFLRLILRISFAATINAMSLVAVGYTHNCMPCVHYATVTVHWYIVLESRRQYMDASAKERTPRLSVASLTVKKRARFNQRFQSSGEVSLSSKQTK